jgi:ubiquinone/menaquinone biosynthesis C-methylase UbiE
MKMNLTDLPLPPRPTVLAQVLLRPWIREGDLVIDATAGNGHDTLFLAECVGVTGKVLAFDVQQAALVAARKRLAEAGCLERVEFFHESHREIGAYASHKTAAVIMFNLGYLPGEDHELTTLTGETLAALEAASRTIKSGGALSVICYPGHASGAEEAEAVEVWMSQLTDQGWRVAKYGAIGTKRPAPFL